LLRATSHAFKIRCASCGLQLAALYDLQLEPK
jgi:hypothetical protein